MYVDVSTKVTKPGMLYFLSPTGLESVDDTTVLGKLDWHFIRGKQLSNNFTAVAIASYIDSGNSSCRNRCAVIVYIYQLVMSKHNNKINCKQLGILILGSSQFQ